MATPDRNKDGAPPREIHIEGKKDTNWLAWLALAAGLIALLFALSRCNRQDTTTAATTNTAQVEPAPTVVQPTTAAPAFTSGLGTYLGGTGDVPQTFAFEKLHFDTAKSVVRAEDRPELADAAAALKQYGSSRVRIVGYADARGTSDANSALGKARADSVKAALVASGIDAGRIETASGGESSPADTNATASGQAENRRTELVVLQR